MGLFIRKGQPNTPAVEEDAATAPTVRALGFLTAAAAAKPDADVLVIEERAVWQPDSWLLQRCWHELAAAGAAQAALEVATHLQTRNPLTRVQALYQIAHSLRLHPIRTRPTADASAPPNQTPQQNPEQNVRQLVAQEIRRVSVTLFKQEASATVFKYADQLLYVGAAAAQLGNLPLAAACLERLDQLDRPWDRIFIPTETRNVLAETVMLLGLHPLTDYLLAVAIRRYEEPGAQFLHQVMRLAGARINHAPTGRRRTLAQSRLARRTGRLLQRGVEVFRFSTLSTLTTRRLAATTFGQMGEIDDVLEQIETIANVQAARQETGLGGGRSDPHFLRQVKRPTANLDIDFQVYTLQEAIKAMPLRTLPRVARIQLADRVAELATKSDGWTAAGAVATLVELGALRYAVRVMDFIPPTDATRSEGVISLVRALLGFHEVELAHEQVEKALAWAKGLPGRNPERALIWGLAEVFMEYNLPQVAIELLDSRITPPGFGDRVRRLFGNAPNDDELRDNRLRFQALILQDAGPGQTVSPDKTVPQGKNDMSVAPDADAPAPDPMYPTWTREKDMLYRQLRQWAPRLLDGESLINFYVEGLLRPLFIARQIDLIIQLLPEIRTVLQNSTGDKHTVHMRKIALLLAQAIDPDYSVNPGGVFPGNVFPGSVGAGSGSGGSSMSAGGSNPTALGARRLPVFDADEVAAMQLAFTEFLAGAWADDAPRGIWQMVHSLEGSLPLLLALEGPQALVDIAAHTAENGPSWTD